MITDDIRRRNRAAHEAFMAAMPRWGIMTSVPFDPGKNGTKRPETGEVVGGEADGMEGHIYECDGNRALNALMGDALKQMVEYQKAEEGRSTALLVIDDREPLMVEGVNILGLYGPRMVFIDPVAIREAYGKAPGALPSVRINGKDFLPMVAVAAHEEGLV